MLQINDLTFRIDGRPLFQQASAQIADGWKVGLVGRNGTGKSTLLRLIREDLAKGEGRRDGTIRINRGARMGFVAQEVAPSDETLLDVVLASDVERTALMKEAETAEDPMRIGEIYTRLADIDAYSAEARASAHLRAWILRSQFESDAIEVSTANSSLTLTTSSRSENARSS
jgi:ATP-binding cassette subfamily F protein 3